MSFSYSDRSSDLLCGEDSGILFGESPECSSDLESPACSEESIACSEESIAGFIEDERNFVPGFDYLARIRSQSLDASVREESVAWILKVQAYYGFQPLTAYLSVNYMDRFLYARRLPQASGWPMQLLSVACLSLAAKMEEPLVPSLLDLQVEGAKFIFESKTVRRMELLVLSVLDWRLRSITPFSFIAFFVYKLDPTGNYVGFLTARATEIILSNVKGYWPSCIAASAILCASSDIPNLALVNPEHAESWCDGLSKEKIMNCYHLMQEIVVGNSRRKPPKVLPQFRVTTWARRIRSRTTTTTDYSSASSSSISLSSSSSPSSYKRRKLGDCLWAIEDDKGNSG
ncbi:cyclin-D1-1 isoform X2 [Malania oleifera]|uniref:cyclin-D1-1 isoform X2 n=1 Tax=Malania oleifera TaxID=397392 RepID=UPI0025ADF2EE|nr:cyclin-D1-1 isoform X2 [Malania oleifera]